MCLIIARKRGTVATIPATYITLAAENNPDGFGIVGKDKNGKVWLNRTLNMEEAENLIRVYENSDMDFVAHFRWATHGNVDLENTHPFQLHGLNYLVHNGICTIPTPVKEYSDTWHLVQDLRDSIASYDNMDKVRGYFDSRPKVVGGSKFALLGEDIPLTIIGRKLGVEKDGIWYSNSDNFEKRYYATKYFSDYSSEKWKDSDRWEAWASKERGNAAYDAEDVARDSLTRGTACLEDLVDLDKWSLRALCRDFPDEIADVIRDAAYYVEMAFERVAEDIDDDSVIEDVEDVEDVEDDEVAEVEFFANVPDELEQADAGH